jgi:hypothetical protein
MKHKREEGRDLAAVARAQFAWADEGIGSSRGRRAWLLGKLRGLAFVAALAGGTLRSLALATGLVASAGLSLAPTEATAQGAVCSQGSALSVSATACGLNATAGGGGATAIGSLATSNEFLSTAIGRQASVTTAVAGNNAGIAIGTAAVAHGDGISIGPSLMPSSLATTKQSRSVLPVAPPAPPP